MILARSLAAACAQRTPRVLPDGRAIWVSRVFPASGATTETPMASFVEQLAHTMIPSHFHAVNQFQVVVEGQGLALRVPELTDALLFIELEGKKDKFHVGYWLSVYDEAQAKALETPAKHAFRGIHESLPK